MKYWCCCDEYGTQSDQIRPLDVRKIRLESRPPSTLPPPQPPRVTHVSCFTPQAFPHALHGTSRPNPEKNVRLADTGRQSLHRLADLSPSSLDPADGYQMWVHKMQNLWR